MNRRGFLGAAIGGVLGWLTVGKRAPKTLIVADEKHKTFASFGEYLVAVREAGRGNGVDPRLEKLTP